MIIYKNDYIRNKFESTLSKKTSSSLLSPNKKKGLTETNIEYLRSLNLHLKK